VNDRGKLRRAHLFNEDPSAQYIKQYLAGRTIFVGGLDQQTIVSQDSFNYSRLRFQQLKRDINLGVALGSFDQRKRI
jgi:hypothetical protein